MQFLHNLPIKRKLMAITMLVSGTALLVACAAFMVYEQAAARKQMAQALGITAAMTAANSTAGLSFNEAGSVEQALKSLNAEPDIVQACVYDKDGRQFARYVRDSANTNSPPPPVENTGRHFIRQHLDLFQPISLAGETIGTIYLEEDLSQMTARLWRYALIGLLVLLGSAGVAFFLSARLQKIISKPLSDLASTVAAIRTKKDYSVRATRLGDDELGSLIDGFNEMLGQIQERDTNLERRVAGRTQELAESLTVLNATLGSTADGILVVDTRGKKVFQNRRTVELWKIPPAIAESDDDKAQVQFIVNAVTDPAKLAEQIAYYYAHPDEKGQAEVQLKDGTIMERITAPVLDKEGRNYGRIWTFRDVTQSRKYEAALRESQARFKFIFESVPVGIASHMVHPDGRIAREINAAHLRISGLTREQHDQPGIYAKLDHPEDHARQQEFMCQVNAGSRQQFSMEKRYLRLDGTMVWVVFSYQRQRYADGGFEELTTLVDITESKRAEEALRESEASYHSLVDQMPAGMFRKDKAGRYVFVNSWFCRTRDAKPEDYLGKMPLEIKTSAGQGPDLSGLFAIGTRHHQSIMETGQQIEVEEQFTMANGKLVHHHVVKSPVFGPDGTVVGSQGILLDITQRKLAEAELARERELLQALMESSNDYIYFKDAQSRFIKASHSQARRFGANSPDEVAGKTDFDFFSEDHARPAFEDEQQIIRTGQPMIGKMEREFWNDGRAVSCVLTTKMPLRNKIGEIIGTFGISKDITAIKQAESALAYERDLLKALLDQSPDCIFFKDRQSHYVRVSRSEVETLYQIDLNRHPASHSPDGAADLPGHLAGLKPFHEFVIGKSDSDIYGPEFAGEFGHDEDEIIRTGKSLSGKIEKIISPDGRAEWFLTNKTAWYNQDGEIIGTFGTSRNITDLKQAEAKIEQTHQQLLETSRLAGMAEVATSVLHNVGNVLNSVNVSTTLVLDLVKKSRLNNLGRLAVMVNSQQNNLAAFFTTDPRGKQLPDYLAKLAGHLAGEQAELVAEIELTRKNIEHIKDIVTMQQNYAKVSGVVEKVKVTDLVEDALRMNAGALTRHSVQVVRDYPAEAIECNIERQKVLQILVNLIRNSKYACDDSGQTEKQLTVQVRVSDGRVQIAVLDNGVGDPRRKHEPHFQPRFHHAPGRPRLWPA